jgi:nucleolar complex protein 3
VTSLASIVREDTTGNMSLHTVRLLSRTVKARGYHIHPAALACLLSLRFPDMGVRASRDSVDRPTYDRRQPAFNKKGKIVDKQYMNKKARKALREKKEIEKEMAEAENEMKSEEVTRNSTETLKLLFALYFRILKMPLAKEDEGRPKSLADKKKMEELLPAALEGLTRFAHLVNVDFFRDLLDVLRQVSAVCHDSRTQLLCIGTALDLLSGQGELRIV